MARTSLRSLFSRRENPGPRVAGDPLRHVRVHAISAVSERALLLDLRAAPEAPELGAFSPGAHLDLHVDDRLVRQYSIVGSPRDGDGYLVCVQREDNGRGGSLAVHERVQVGDELRISAPRNTFSLRSDAESALLLAGGVGITPLVSMAEQLHRVGTDFELHAYARDRASLPLADFLESRSYRDHVVPHFSSTGDSFRSSWPKALTEPASVGAIYLCGPQAFIDLARSRAIEAGWDPADVLSEQFVPSAPTAVDAAAGTFTVVAASTRQAMDVAPHETIADVLERNGYETYRSCGQGYCGSCVTRVVSGTPDHRDETQSEAEHATNSQINVCCSRSLSPVLELDI